jgi:hypothetical protein
MRHWTFLILLLGCLSCSITTTEQSEIPPSFPVLSDPTNVLGTDQLNVNTALQNTARSSQNIYENRYQVNFGPQVVNIRASYRERPDLNVNLNSDPATANIPRYFDLRATSVLAGTSLVSDGEMSYSVPDSSADSMWPAMVRFGLANRWRDLTYGADYKSVAKGFMARTGAIADQSRDEALIWGEHGVGPFNLRGSIGESWERLIDTADLRVTRSATAAIQINRARWGGSFSTTYGLIEQGSGPNEESAVLIKRITTSYRPADFLSLEPNFTVKEEWNQSTGVRTQTPTSGFSFMYSPIRDLLKLTGGTFFSRTFNSDGSNDVSIHGTSAAVDWRIGNFLGRDNTLSFTVNYNRQLDHVFRSNSLRDLSSMLQFKIADF